MPHLLPFRALRYDARAVPDLSAVLCPPYDVIGPAERERLAARDTRNAVHLELPATADGADPYTNAARLLADWQAQGVLRLDDRPLIYVYEQNYQLPGSSRPGRARGLFCRLGLEEPGTGVLRHEHTMSAPKEDRFALLRATRTNLSPVLLLYRSADGGRGSADLLDRLTHSSPLVEARSDEGTRHVLWAVDPAATPEAAGLLDLAGRGPLTIADGHHRYETSLRFRAEVGGPGSEHVLALLYDAGSGGLAVLPTHRLLHGLPESEALLAGVSELFEVEPINDAVRLENGLAGAGSGTMGLWMRHGGFLMRPRRNAIEPLLPKGSAALRSLDVAVLGAAIERLTGLAAGQLADQGRLSYAKDFGGAVSSVEAGDADACFLLNATPIEQVLEVAAAGEVMPAKSTYFVPKAASGLVFNLLSA